MLTYFQDSCKRCEEQIQENAAEILAYDTRIANQETAASRVDPAIAKLRQDIEGHSELLSNLRRQRPRTEQDVQEAESAFEVAQEAESKAQSEALQAAKNEQASKEAIDNLRSQSTNRLNAFGSQMPLVMAEINKARWSHSKPIGPLGMHVKLKNVKYRDAFHRVLGSTLCQFAVRCEQDRRTMMEILKRCSRQ